MPTTLSKKGKLGGGILGILDSQSRKKAQETHVSIGFPSLILIFVGISMVFAPCYKLVSIAPWCTAPASSS